TATIATTTAVSPAATTSVATATAAATAAIFPRSGLVDRQRAALVILAVQGIDGLLGLGVIVHFHKAKAPGAAGLPIGDHLGSSHVAVLLKQGQEVVGRRLPCEVADVDILRHLKNLSVPIRRSEFN